MKKTYNINLCIVQYTVRTTQAAWEQNVYIPNYGIIDLHVVQK